MRGVRSLRIVNHSLQTIALPSLKRPLGKPDEAKTEELTQWGISVYVYSLLAHVQKILAGLVQLAEAENTAASAPVCRHVFEWTALSCLLTATLREQFKQQDWEQAWESLTRIVLGSRWMRRYGDKYAREPPERLKIDVPEPIYIPNAVKEYERYQAQNSGDAEARDSYSFLCDHAHANAACLLRYQQQENNGAAIQFVDPDRDAAHESFLPFVNCCLIDLLTFVYELLGIADESRVRPKVLLALKELARLAPSRLTGSMPG